MKQVLYICDGNVARSQEAEIFTNALGSGTLTSTSAGTNPKVGKPIDPMVVAVMREDGYNMGQNFRKPIDRQAVDNSDIIISFKNANELPDFVREHKNVRYWDIADPRGQSIETHRLIRDLIKAGVETLISEEQ